MPRRKVSLGVDGEETAAPSIEPNKEEVIAETPNENDVNAEADNGDNGNEKVEAIKEPLSTETEDEEDFAVNDESDENENDLLDLGFIAEMEDEEDANVNNISDKSEDDSENEDIESIEVLNMLSDPEDDFDTDDESDQYDDKDEYEEQSDVEDIPQSIPTLNRIRPNAKKTARRINLNNDFDFKPSLKMKWDDLYKGLKDKKVFRARIIKLLETKETVAAECQIADYEEFKILIPGALMDFIDNPAESKREKELSIINQMIGAEINLVIEQLDYGSKIGIGNRALANFFLRRRFYYRGFRRFGSGRKNVIRAGTEINGASIVKVNSNSVDVEIQGAVAKIKIEDLSHDFISSAFQKFNVGGKINVVVKEVLLAESNIAKNGYPVNIKVSMLELEENNASIALAEAKEGSVEMAEVIRIIEKPSSGITILLHTLSGYNCYARRVNYKIIRQLREGSLVKIRLLVKRQKKNGRDVGIVDILTVLSN